MLVASIRYQDIRQDSFAILKEFMGKKVSSNNQLLWRGFTSVPSLIVFACLRCKGLLGGKFIE
jgi:hypothetical protein